MSPHSALLLQTLLASAGVLTAATVAIALLPWDPEDVAALNNLGHRIMGAILAPRVQPLVPAIAPAQVR